MQGFSWHNRAHGLRAFTRLSRTLGSAACACLVLLAATTVPARAGWNGMTRIASDLGGVTTMAQAPGDPNRVFVGVKEGGIKIVDLVTGEYKDHLFLNLFDVVDSESEGGLTGMAFHPDYAQNGKFYLTMTIDNGGIVIDPGNATTPPVLSPYTAHVREYTVSSNPDVAEKSSGRDVLQWVKPYYEHTSGWLGFGPHDGLLYVTTGDGGGILDGAPGHTPGIGNAQDITNNWLGKMLRVDVNGDDFPLDPTRNYSVPVTNPFVDKVGDDEIFANGLRNPWGVSWDLETGDMWIADVGEAIREEINFIPAGSQGGQNFGWRLREGSDRMPYDGGGLPPARNVHPVYDYFHQGLGDPAFSGHSVTGGFVYRGPDQDLQGQYVFADFIGRKIWMFDPADPYGTVQNVTSQLVPDAGTIDLLTTFFQDATGNLYLGTLNGNIFRLEAGSAQPGDFNEDGYVNGYDLALWSDSFGIEEPDYGDIDRDGDVDGNDFLVWQRNVTATSQPLANAGGGTVPEPTAGLLAALAIAAAAAHCRRRRE
jgi:MYXO-CTERM domain-containing protein